MKPSKEVIWVDQTTYRKIADQLKKYGACNIEAMGCDPIILKGRVE